VDHLCGDCLLFPKAFSRARAFGYYDTILLEAIHTFKYQGDTSLGRHLGRMMAGCDFLDFPVASASFVVPVPLHPKRLRQRSFNQALILARAVAERYAILLDFTSLTRGICIRRLRLLWAKRKDRPMSAGLFRSSNRKP
jgi:predicted amidophosphoribosyltransferase